MAVGTYVLVSGLLFGGVPGRILTARIAVHATVVDAPAYSDPHDVQYVPAARAWEVPWCNQYENPRSQTEASD